MRATPLWNLALAAVLTSCEVDPEDPLFLAGEVQLADGGPAAGATLTLERSSVPAPQLLPVDVRMREPVPLTPLKTLTAREDGSWRAEVLSFEAITSWKGTPMPRLMRLSHRDAAGRGQTSVSFALKDDDVVLPPLQPWDDQLQGSYGSFLGLKFEFATLPPEVPASPLQPDEDAYRKPQREGPFLVLENETGVAYQGRVQPNVPLLLQNPLGRFWLEDFHARARVVVRSPGTWFYDSLLRGPTGGKVDYVVEHSLGPVDMPNGELTAFTRGATCPHIASAGPCPFTDGRLEAVHLPPGTPIEIELAQPVNAQKIAVLMRGAVLGYLPEMQLLLRYESEEQWVAPPMDPQNYPDEDDLRTDEEHFVSFIASLESGKRLTGLRLSVREGSPDRLVSLREVSAFALP